MDDAASFLSGGGEMGRRMRSHDWAGTPLGPPQTWPQSLRTVVSACLNSPMLGAVLWGPDLLFLYNDAYIESLADRHPAALGRPVADVWGESWAQVAAPFREAMATGLGFEQRRVGLTMVREGRAEITWWDFTAAPIRGEDGRIAGLLNQGTEITRQVRSEAALHAAAQRQSLLADVSDALLRSGEAREAIDATVERLGRYLGADRVGYGEVQDDDATLVLGSCYAAGVAPLTGRVPLARFAADGIARRRGGETQHAGDVEADPGHDPAVWRAIETRAFASVPLVRDGRLVALLYVHYRAPHRWTDDELGLVKEVAVRTWAAVERARAEAALRESEERLRLATEHSESGFWDVDIVNDLLVWPPRVKALFGISPDVPVTMADFYAGLHPDDLAATSIAYASAADPVRRSLYDVEYRTIGKEDGIVRWVAAKGRGIFDANGRCIRIIGTAVDISARKAAEAAIRDLNATLESRVEERTRERDRAWKNSRDLQLVIDTAGIFRAVNEAWTTILGWRPDELVGRANVDFVHPDDDPISEGALAAAARTALPVYENRYRHRDGSWRWISWVAAPEDDLVYASGRDVTADKLRQAELAAAQDALRQSQKMEAVGQLTGGIAHDFNNMLAVVIGSLDLLKRRAGATDPRAQRHVDAAADAARRAATLTQRLLAFSRQQPLKPEPVDANKLVSGMSDLLRHSLGGAIELRTVLEAGLWRTHADPNQLENVILNLAVNARDAMPDGGRLTIETRNAEFDAHAGITHPGLVAGQYVLLAVTDTGWGMSQEVVAKAFDPFFTTKEVGKGTGLGLSQVYGFVKQSGGYVKIHSETGRGTTVMVYLPRLVGAGEDTVDDESPPPLPLGAPREVVLVVEDEPAVRQLSVDALTDLGYRVLEADGARAALRLLDAHPEIVLMFTDVVMPEVNGARLAAEATARRPALKVLFTTGYTRDAVVHDGTADRAVELLGKPFTIEELAAKVRAVLDAR